MIGRNDECWCGSGAKWKKCHYPETGPAKEPSQKNQLPTKQILEKLADIYFKRYEIILKTPEQIEGIRQAGKLAAQILDATCLMAKAGVTTLELNDFAHKLHEDAGAIPAPLHYGNPPFPKSICTSVNDVICHGIPDKTPLKNGDIVNIDVTSILNGYYGDCSRMVMIGVVDDEKKRVCDVAYECLMRSISILKPEIPLSHIGDVIQTYAEAHNCSVVTQFVGHGVGVHFHEAPQVPHYRTPINLLLAPGMTFTIEPMINAGVKEGVIDPHDKWTARTKDGKASAQWEHTILITETGHEILTPWVR
jgi:methionyl aminopeptidase